MVNNHPYGRITAQERYQRIHSYDGKIIVLLLFPLACLLIVLYEVSYLQKIPTFTLPSSRGNLIINPNIRRNSPRNVKNVVNGRTTMIMIANYRDSFRCSETLSDIFDKAVEPDLLTISIFDQIYVNNETSCGDTYCKKVGEINCRRNQILNSTIDASEANGPTGARYETEKKITDQDFCLAIDSHLMFVDNWDKVLYSQWDLISNPNAIITVYPKSTDLKNNTEYRIKNQLMCISRIETDDKDTMIQYGAPNWIDKEEKPRLQSQFAGGFNFGTCEQAKSIRNDPYTPFLFHGEEYSRATRLWTSGYDFYTPSEDIVYHWYEKRHVIWETDWARRYAIQQKSKRRIRAVLGLSITNDDYNKTDIEKFSIGNKRTMEQWKLFSKIDPNAPYISATAEQFKNCGRLQYVPYKV